MLLLIITLRHIESFQIFVDREMCYDISRNPESRKAFVGETTYLLTKEMKTTRMYDQKAEMLHTPIKLRKDKKKYVFFPSIFFSNVVYLISFVGDLFK